MSITFSAASKKRPAFWGSVSFYVDGILVAFHYTVTVGACVFTVVYHRVAIFQPACLGEVDGIAGTCRSSGSRVVVQYYLIAVKVAAGDIVHAPVGGADTTGEVTAADIDGTVVVLVAVLLGVCTSVEHLAFLDGSVCRTLAYTLRCRCRAASRSDSADRSLLLKEGHQL